MEERRKLLRRHLYYYSRVYDESTHEMAGRLVDITREGMMMVSENPVKSETQFTFKLILPKPIEGKKYLVVEARSKWSKKAGVEDRYDNGFKLININAKAAEMIDRMVCRAGVL